MKSIIPLETTKIQDGFRPGGPALCSPRAPFAPARWRRLSSSVLCTAAVLLFLGGNRVSAQNTDSPLDAWYWRMPLPQGNNLAVLAYGDGAWLAGGEGDRVVLSTNGADWTAHEISVWREYGPAGGSVSHLARGNGRWLNVAYTVAGVLLATSADGRTWTNAQALPPPAYVFSLAGGPQGFVAVTSLSNNLPLTSADGLNWEAPAFSPPPGTEVFSTAAYVNGRFLLVGSSNLWWSLDGRNFARGGSHPFQSFPQVIWGNGQYVASSNTRFYSSADSVNWELRYAGSGDDAFVGLAFGNGRFLATGGNIFGAGGVVVGSRVLVSTNGVDWTTNVTAVSNTRFFLPVGGDTGFVRVGDSGNIISSTDGIIWEPRVQATRNNFRGVAQEGGLYVAVGNDGKLVTSSNGVQWTQRPSGTTNDLRAVAAGNGRWVAVGAPGALVASTDGLHWTPDAIPIANLYGVAFGDGQFVAVGEGAVIWRSTDGLVWQNVRAGTNNLRLHGITYGPAGWVATGRSLGPETPAPVTTALLLISSNAIDWISQAVPVASYLQSVTFGHGLYVAVGTPPTILVSSNAVTWMNTTPAPLIGPGDYVELDGVTAGNGTWVVVGWDGLIFSSYDGFQWTWRYSGFGSRNLRSVTYANGVFTAVGNNDTILQSGNVLPRLAGAVRSGGFEMSVRGETNRTYALEASADLALWESVGAVTNTQFTSTWLDALPNAPARRFYRATAK